MNPNWLFLTAVIVALLGVITAKAAPKFAAACIFVALILGIVAFISFAGPSFGVT